MNLTDSLQFDAAEKLRAKTFFFVSVRYWAKATHQHNILTRIRRVGAFLHGLVFGANISSPLASKDSNKFHKFLASSPLPQDSNWLQPCLIDAIWQGIYRFALEVPCISCDPLCWAFVGAPLLE